MFKILFIIFIITILYAYLGYSILLCLLSSIKSFLVSKKSIQQNDTLNVTLLISCYNEMAVLPDKVKNCFELNYPKDKLKFVFVTDGSNDGSEKWLQQQEGLTVHHQNEREGKTAAINRVMPFIETPIVVFCDANTILNSDAIKNISYYFNNNKVGCVAGEKKVLHEVNDSSAGSGESLYWRYESFMKKYEANLSSTTGAAGELFAIRTELFDAIPNDTILDDFVISTNVIKKGLSIKYAPNACSMEKGSASFNDEFKRKIRIAAGGFQLLFRNFWMFNIFKYGFFSIQFISHKVLRWSIVPFCFVGALITNMLIYLQTKEDLFLTLLILQFLFYFIAFLGLLFRNVKTKFTILFLPFYVVMMNVAQFFGLIKQLRGAQSVIWEKVIRE